jgi:hypothetical protein
VEDIQETHDARAFLEFPLTHHFLSKKMNAVAPQIILPGNVYGSQLDSPLGGEAQAMRRSEMILAGTVKTRFCCLRIYLLLPLN